MRSAIITILLVFLSGCGNWEFTGDGKLTDKGIFAAKNRYMLDLGEIDLKKLKKKEYRFSGLPEENFVVGVEMESDEFSDYDIEDRNLAKSTLRVILKNSQGTVLFDETGPFNKWVWSQNSSSASAFLYFRDPGTYFDALSDEEYILSTIVLDSNKSDMQFNPRLLAYSGGWK